jgi:5-(carboxyamino)imidazole ribonucleotide mutase
MHGPSRDGSGGSGGDRNDHNGSAGAKKAHIRNHAGRPLGHDKLRETYNNTTLRAARPAGKRVCQKSTGRSTAMDTSPVVGVIMGSQSDWETMRHAADTLRQLQIAYEAKVVSAHRTPDLLFEYAASAESRGLKVLIAGAGGAAHLPGMVAAKTVLPVLGVPVESKVLRGVDSLLSIVQMPAGIPVGTLAIGQAGAINAALLAAAILAASDPALRERLHQFRVEQTRKVLGMSLE